MQNITGKYSTLCLVVGVEWSWLKKSWAESFLNSTSYDSAQYGSGTTLLDAGCL